MKDIKAKAGENEALEILKKKGMQFLESYRDDGTENGMPDYMFDTGEYLEVTHTDHNIHDWQYPNRFAKKSFDERLQIAESAQLAYERLQNNDYETDATGSYTQDGQKRYDDDVSLVNSHYGYDPVSHSHSERRADIKACQFSIMSIIDTINVKAAKHPNAQKKNVHLFIYITKDEYGAFCGDIQNFIDKAKHSPFEVIYLCVWDLLNNKYEIDNPTLVRICYSDDPPSVNQI